MELVHGYEWVGNPFRACVKRCKPLLLTRKMLLPQMGVDEIFKIYS